MTWQVLFWLFRQLSIKNVNNISFWFIYPLVSSLKSSPYSFYLGIPMYQKWSLPLTISSVNITKSAIPLNLATFPEGILNEKLHFLCSFNKGKKGAFSRPEPWTFGVLTMDFRFLLLFQKVEMEWQIIQEINSGR